MKTSFYLSPTLLRRAKTRALTEGISLRALLVRALTAYLASTPRQEDDDA